MKKYYCKNCNKELTQKQIKKALENKREPKFCSNKCVGIFFHGDKNPMYGIKLEGPKNGMYKKHHTAESKNKMSKTKSEMYKGKNNPFYNKKHKKETREKFSERMGEKNHMYGKHHTEETKRKQRLAHIKNIEENNGVCFPNYNKEACEYFRKFDEEHNTKGRYAIYGNGEYFIKELGYWPDYINFDMKLIIEWDEEYHKKIKDKDMIRQNQIKQIYPDFEFIRIKR
jgi:hypothetical protein